VPAALQSGIKQSYVCSPDLRMQSGYQLSTHPIVIKQFTRYVIQKKGKRSQPVKASPQQHNAK
jgi:hypothetical protein